MLVLTPVPAFHSGLYGYPSHVRAQPDYFDSKVERTAADYAYAHARAELLRRQKQQEQRRHYFEQLRRQSALEAFYEQQDRFSGHFAQFAEPAYSLFEDENDHFGGRRNGVTSARQREQEYARALRETRARSAIDAREQQFMSALLALSESANESRLTSRRDIHPKRLQQHSPSPSHPQTGTSAGIDLHPYASNATSVQQRLEEPLRKESDSDIRATVESLLSIFTSSPQGPSELVDPKGKGKASETSKSEPSQRANSTSAPRVPVPLNDSVSDEAALKSLLRQRLNNESDPEIKESLSTLYSKLYGAPVSPTPDRQFVDVKGKGKAKAVDAEAQPIEDSPVTTGPQPTTAGSANLHRTPDIPSALAAKVFAVYRSRRARQVSLGAIQEIEDTLRALEASFVFPSHVDFSPAASPVASGSSNVNKGLMYTSNNTAIHAYEHSLNGLLAQLDAIESRGDLEIRGRRKEVVKEVERALRDVERRVEESRERDSADSVRSQSQSGVHPARSADDQDNGTTTQNSAASPRPDDTVPSFSASLDSAPSVDSSVTITPIVEPSPHTSHDAYHNDSSALAASTTALSQPPINQLVTEPAVIPSELGSSQCSPASPQAEASDLLTGLGNGEVSEAKDLSQETQFSLGNGSNLDQGAEPAKIVASEGGKSSVKLAPSADTLSPHLSPTETETRATVYSDHGLEASSRAALSQNDAFLLSSPPVEVPRHLPQTPPSADEAEFVDHEDSVNGSDWSEVEA